MVARPPQTLSERTDQAAGLRRLFSGGTHQRHVAVAANPHVLSAGVLLERLTAALAAQGCHTLVVDAADNAPTPAPAVLEDPALGIERLSDALSYLGARGLPPRLAQTPRNAAQWLLQLAAATPQADVLLVHAGAAELSRFFDGRALQPLVLAAEDADSLTHALASLRLLASRHHCTQFDLLLGTPVSSPQAARAARHLAGCARTRLGMGLREGVAVDPARDMPPGAVPAALARLAAALLEQEELETGKWPLGGGGADRAVTSPARNL
ncbi:flagellar biosynthesis protein [Azohydromonas caseinilytica]|uniref:Flagellar biosynthesis protein n=1 Tax=Azohydromonas caseinilytica TaxID=2728836 RepID=A0A848F496_9BURK|nr:flagellar biosynthesis protein [Azohydromonas caseinilytica]NML14897.1 flagellar biosynthesis protein [Azohydromonas caseinilytica]